MDNATKTLTSLVRARYSLVSVVSHEETRVEHEIHGVAKSLKKDLLFWSISRGFSTSTDEVERDIKDPISALARIYEHKGRSTVWVLRDFHPFLQDPTVRRCLRDLAVSLRTAGRDQGDGTIVLLSPTLEIPGDLEKDIAVIDWDLPTEAELGEILDQLLSQMPGKQIDRERVLEAARGLTAVEAENAFAKAVIENGLSAKSILSAKKDAVRKSGVLEYVDTPKTLEEVGGLDVLKGWLTRRRRAFSAEAKSFGIDTPKGMLLIGPPGSGKSLVAKAVSTAWQLPLVRLDVSRLLGSLVGESEGNLRGALKVIEGIAPCVVWVDEIEKALAGSGSDTSGVSTRIMGSLLTWMQEKTAPAYVVATANDVSALPPELLRKGRFDEIFVVDLPTPKEREAIAKVHLTKRGRDASQYDLRAISEATSTFAGAEIEQVVVEALHAAFDGGREVTTADIVEAAKATSPLSVTMKERIQELRNWAKGRARLASESLTESGAKRRVMEIDHGN